MAVHSLNDGNTPTDGQQLHAQDTGCTSGHARSESLRACHIAVTQEGTEDKHPTSLECSQLGGCVSGTDTTKDLVVLGDVRTYVAGESEHCALQPSPSTLEQ